MLKQYDKYLVDENFNIYSARTNKKLTPHKGTDGYMQVECRDKDGHLNHQRVHVILAHCFLPNPNQYKYVNHIDSDKTNNALSNLEWCSNSQNVKHGWDNGRNIKWRIKVKAINKETKETFSADSIKELSKILHLDRHKVSRILKGEYKNVYMYDFQYID